MLFFFVTKTVLVKTILVPKIGYMPNEVLYMKIKKKIDK